MFTEDFYSIAKTMKKINIADNITFLKMLYKHHKEKIESVVDRLKVVERKIETLEQERKEINKLLNSPCDVEYAIKMKMAEIVLDEQEE